MAKSKREKNYKFTKVKPKQKERKSALIENLRKINYEYFYLINLDNQRNAFLKKVRDDLKPGRIFLGKNKVMKHALGTSPENELFHNIHLLTEELVGFRGLLCTDSPPEEILKYFAQFRPDEYAKCGFIAPDDMILKKGSPQIAQFPHSMEPQLRKLGLPTLLSNGEISMMGDFSICKEGQPLSPEAAQILKLLKIKLGTFSVQVEKCLTKSGEIINYKD
eukprot:GHVL01026839.1.p1 GENE.GHVL01026839.1~~GHVL01026839.1.p1  ORF type:complete len:220 (-),score=39.41 GHVL01026839.1:20-679(-)